MSEPPAVVCVIDDSEAVRKALTSLIRSVGLQAKIFATPREYLAWKRPDVSSCLILDVRLPGKSGLELQRELAESNNRIPIIFITAHADVPMSVQAMKAGAVEFLTKPFRDQDLLDAIQTALERDRLARAYKVVQESRDWGSLPASREAGLFIENEPQRPEPLLFRRRSDTQFDESEMRNALPLYLPEQERQRLFQQLTFVPLRTNDVILEDGEPIKYGYFINDGLVSILNVMEDGRSVEVASLGREGFLGVPLLVGFYSQSGRAVVEIEGSGFRILASALNALLTTCPVLFKTLNRYAQVRSLQAAQTAACNRLHGVEQRLARWLLMCQNKIDSNLVPLTQESLAQLLGARRSSVTVAAGALQAAGIISYTAGQVKILDRDGLENAACECYAAMVGQALKWTQESA